MITPVKHWSKRENLMRSMRQKLRFFGLSILICFCIFFALSCSPSGSDPLEIMKSGFTAHVSVSGYSIEFDAVLSLAPPSETGERDFDLRFISPESLCGIRLMRTGDGLSVLLGEDLFTETEFEKFRDLAILCA